MDKPVFRFGFGLLSTAIVAFAFACGGGEGAKTPANTSNTGEAAANAANSGTNTPSENAGPGGGSTGAGTGGSTTTTQLGDGGDLQGAKLGSSVHTETESKGDGGPRSTGGQSSNEPGRGLKDIETIVKVRRDDARACYDKGLKDHPGIEGDLDVKWTIDPEGAVKDAAVDTSKSTILEPSVGACVVEVIKKIKFAKSAKGYETHAHYPFNFHPKSYTAKDAGK